MNGGGLGHFFFLCGGRDSKSLEKTNPDLRVDRTENRNEGQFYGSMMENSAASTCLTSYFQKIHSNTT